MRPLPVDGSDRQQQGGLKCRPLEVSRQPERAVEITQSSSTFLGRSLSRIQPPNHLPILPSCSAVTFPLTSRTKQKPPAEPHLNPGPYTCGSAYLQTHPCVFPPLSGKRGAPLSELVPPAVC